MTNCPKCGFEQQGGEECLSCGVIFARYQPEPTRPAPTAARKPEVEAESPSAFVVFYRIFRWVVLAAVVFVALVILKKAPPPPVAADPEVPERLEAKLEAAERAAQLGMPHTLELDSAEINHWLQSNLALAREGGGPPATGPGEPTLEEVQSSVRDVKVVLVEDRVRAYVLFDYHGKDLTLTLEGRLRAENGYLRFEPTSGHLGSLPLPQAALDRATQRLFDDPENRERFRLPPGVSDVRIENSALRVSYR
ncbi:MAG: hypothetical protein L0212_05830 [Acidobacteria bacterium]|nr:hypothetical protein [Acidobacteriota bacterium]